MRRPAATSGFARLLFLLAAVLALAGCGVRGEETGASTSQEEEDSTRLVVLHTNDLHGHLRPWKEWQGEHEGRMRGGLAPLATAARQAREEAEARGEGVLMLDAGDAIGDTLVQDLTEGEAMVEALNAMNYDAMALGNHETDFGPGRLRELAEGSSFPVLAANVFGEGGEPAFEPYVVREVNGLEVGILGLGYHNTAETALEENVEGLEFGSGVEAARRFVPELRDQGADVVIALSHAGLAVDLELAREVEGIDAIVGGHSHNRVEEPLVENGVPVVQAGAHGSDLGRLELAVGEGGEVSLAGGGLSPILSEDYTPDPEVEAILEEVEEPYREDLDEVVGEAREEMVRPGTINAGEPAPRDEESPADDLFADVLRRRAGTDVAFLPNLGHGVAVPSGEVTRADLVQLLPHRSSKAWTMRMSGEEIRSVLEQSVENIGAEDPEERVGGRIQVSGLSFEYDPEAASGERVREVLVDGESIEPDREYTVATDSSLAEGNYRYREFASAEDRTETDLELTGIVIEHFERNGPVSPPIPNRIEVAPGPWR